ncbi:MAG: nucleotide exchange factor GrpE [Helicobacteraceae bacterium]|nr:nucleotide exchange factor GrpE [Helicobacteraceae bacterium]
MNDETAQKTQEQQAQEAADAQSPETLEAAQTGEIGEPSEPCAEDFEAKYNEAQDRYLRAYAEFENIKKRLEKEKYQAIDYASEGFAKDLLPVIDALEMALKIDQSDHFEQLKEGVNLTKAALIKAFEKHGVLPVTHENGFDPALHEAIMQVNDETLEENAIAQALQQGWRYKERLLRPSLVSVNKRS